MAHATTSGSKRKGGKVTGRGGLGGPGGRGGRRSSIRAIAPDFGASLPASLQRVSARGLAKAAKDAVERGGGTSRATPYRQAMSMIAGFADRNSRHMKPETRKKLADAKVVLRELFDQPQTSYGRGGAGHRQLKTKAKSRRNPR